MESVTAVLLDRSREPAGLKATIVASLALHAGVLAFLFLAPASWRLRAAAEEVGPVMTISLGGAPGPRSGGAAPLGGRPIQSTAPLANPARREPVRAPAARTPEMSLPKPGTKGVPQPVVKSGPDEAQGHTPTRGTEERAGSAFGETGAQGTGFGLSTGGGGTGGYLDVGAFCCPEYLSTMLDLIQRNWSSKQQVEGEALVRFTVLRNGQLTDVTVERSSGFTALDLTAQRAVLVTRQLPPLPGGFPDDHLTVHLVFQYRR
jgi:periplasmic protein TonB